MFGEFVYIRPSVNHRMFSRPKKLLHVLRLCYWRCRGANDLEKQPQGIQDMTCLILHGGSSHLVSG